MWKLRLSVYPSLPHLAPFWGEGVPVLDRYPSPTSVRLRHSDLGPLLLPPLPGQLKSAVHFMHAQ